MTPPSQGGQSHKKRCNCDYRRFARKMIRAAAEDSPWNFSGVKRGREEEEESGSSNRTACRGFYSLYAVRVIRYHQRYATAKSDSGDIAFEKIGFSTFSFFIFLTTLRRIPNRGSYERQRDGVFYLYKNPSRISRRYAIQRQ